MSVNPAQFTIWLGRVMAENKGAVKNVREVGRNAPDTLYVGRARKNENPDVGRFGNPYYETTVGRLLAIQKYVAYLLGKPEHERLMLLLEVRTALDEGKFLLCWCSSPEAPLACHAHVLAGWARSLDVTETRLKIESSAGVVTSVAQVEAVRRTADSASSTTLPCVDDYDPEPDIPDGWESADPGPEQGVPTGPKFAQTRS